MEKLDNDTLGFEQFKIDEQLSSLYSQMLGGYARVAFKAGRSGDAKTVSEFRHRFRELGRLKSKVKYYSYSQKREEIQKFQVELRNLLRKEKTL